MTGETLAVALGRTHKHVLVIDTGRAVAKLTAQQALELISRNPQGWHGCGTKRRVSAIEFRKPVPAPLPDPEWLACWRTVEASVLAFWQEAA